MTGFRKVLRAALALLFLAICSLPALAQTDPTPAAKQLFEQQRWSDVVRRALASVGDLGVSTRPAAGTPRRRYDDPVDDEDSHLAAAIAIVAARTRAPRPDGPDLQLVANGREPRRRRR